MPNATDPPGRNTWKPSSKIAKAGKIGTLLAGRWNKAGLAAVSGIYPAAPSIRVLNLAMRLLGEVKTLNLTLKRSRFSPLSTELPSSI
jgi:hypothetical protein